MNDTIISSLVSDAPKEVFWIVAGVPIVSIITYFCSPTVRIFFRTLRIKIFSEDFRYNVLLKCYFLRKTNDLNSEVYHKIKNKFENYEVKKVSIRPESMTIKPETFGTKIDIEINCINELEAEEPSQIDEESEKEYQLVIKLDTDLRLTYKRLDILRAYIDMFEEIKEIVKEECFDGLKERKSFLLCDIIRDINVIYNQKEIIDDTQHLKISFTRGNIKIVAEKSIYLIDAIQKYIGY